MVLAGFDRRFGDEAERRVFVELLGAFGERRRAPQFCVSVLRTGVGAHLLEGSVQRAGGRVRVVAQLIDAGNDTHLWAEHYDRDFADIFAIQSEIAQQIANQLRA